TLHAPRRAHRRATDRRIALCLGARHLRLLLDKGNGGLRLRRPRRPQRGRGTVARGGGAAGLGQRYRRGQRTSLAPSGAMTAGPARARVDAGGGFLMSRIIGLAAAIAGSLLAGLCLATPATAQAAGAVNAVCQTMRDFADGTRPALPQPID